MGANFANYTASACSSRSQIEPESFKKTRFRLCKNDSDYALHNHYAKFMQDDFAKFMHLASPMRLCLCFSLSVAFGCVFV